MDELHSGHVIHLTTTRPFRHRARNNTSRQSIHPFQPSFNNGESTTPTNSSGQTTQLTRPRKPQLDKLVGLAMLVASSVVFLYYTIWTLLMVSPLCGPPLPPRPPPSTTPSPIRHRPTHPLSHLPSVQPPTNPYPPPKPALRRLRPPPPAILPPPRLGDPHPRDPSLARVRRGRLLPQRGDDPQQPQEGGQGGQSGCGRGCGWWCFGGGEEEGLILISFISDRRFTGRLSLGGFGVSGEGVLCNTTGGETRKKQV